MNTNFYIKNNLVEPPENAGELEVELNFDKDVPTFQVSVNKWRFVRENAGIILDYIEAGKTGGVGVFEGLPFRIDLEHKGKTVTLFDGYIDLSVPVDISCNEIIVETKQKKGIDWLNQRADSVSFQRMFEETLEISKDDFVFMPYVINTIPNYRESAIALLTAFIVKNELERVINECQQAAPKFANPFQAGDWIAFAIYVAYVIVLITVLIKLIIDMVRLLIQPVKYHAGMYVKDSIRIAAQHFNLSFQSSIFLSDPFDRCIIIPEKFSNPESEGLFGFLKPNKNEQTGYYKGTPGQLLRSLKLALNAKIVIKDNVMILERRDFNTSSNLYHLPDLRNDYYSLNTDQFKSNTLISFATDLNDKNTIDQYDGTVYQIITTPIVVDNPDYVLTTGLERIDIPFALAKRKETLTTPERIIKALADAISALINVIITLINALIAVLNAVIKVLNSIIKALKLVGIKIKFDFKPIPKISSVNLAGTIEDRIGMMLLENDFINVPKILIINESSNPRKTKIDVNNGSYLSAEYLWNNFHFINSFVVINDKHNQYKLYDYKDVPFCFDDFELLKDDNIMSDNFGNLALLSSAKYKPEAGVASIKFGVNELYTTNLKNSYSSANGK